MTHDEWWKTQGVEIPTEKDKSVMVYEPNNMVIMYNDSKTSWDASRLNTLEEIESFVRQKWVGKEEIAGELKKLREE